MAKLLLEHDVKALNDLVEGFLSFIDDRRLNHMPGAMELARAYENIGEGGNTAAVIADCVAAAGMLDLSWAATLNAIVSTSIRQLNYPSSWRLATHTAAQSYQAANPGPPMVVAGTVITTWVCPGLSVPTHPAHAALLTDCTVDHDTPVVWHWNNYGYNTNKVERTDWYHDASNHVIMCGPCNSAKSGGGAFYNIVTGPNYSN